MSNRLLTLSTLAGAFLLASCGQPGKVTGGGTMNSAGGAEKAAFTFHADSCTEGVVKGSMNLHDKSAIDFETLNGVKLKADVTDTYFCSGALDFNAPFCSCDPGWQEVLFDYVSTNPDVNGQGNGIACLADFGEKQGADVRGASIVLVQSGPYDGYLNVGTIHGNVQQHECPNG